MKLLVVALTSFCIFTILNSASIASAALCTPVLDNCGGAVGQQCCITADCTNFCLLQNLECIPNQIPLIGGICQGVTPAPIVPLPTQIISPIVDPIPVVPPGVNCVPLVCTTGPCSCPATQQINCMSHGGGVAWCCADVLLCPGYVTTCANLPGGCPNPAIGPFCDANRTQVRTALGCIDIFGLRGFTNIVNWATGIGGTITFILIIISALMITTAQGDPKRVKAGQELLTAAIAGFVLIALSVVIFNFLGVNVLGLNSLGFTIP